MPCLSKVGVGAGNYRRAENDDTVAAATCFQRAMGGHYEIPDSGNTLPDQLGGDDRRLRGVRGRGSYRRCTRRRTYQNKPSHRRLIPPPPIPTPTVEPVESLRVPEVALDARGDDLYASAAGHRLAGQTRTTGLMGRLVFLPLGDGQYLSWGANSIVSARLRGNSR